MLYVQYKLYQKVAKNEIKVTKNMELILRRAKQK